MTALMDARCRKCKAAIGWCGRMTDMPACHRCGAEPDIAALEADQAQMDEFARLLALRTKDCTKDSSGIDLRKRRHAAGLTLMPVANLLGVSAAIVSGWERGEGKPDDQQAAILDQLYGGD